MLTRDDQAVRELVAAVGAHALLLTPERHDLLVAGISHAAFAVSAAYVLALGARAEWPEMAALAGPGFRDLSRLAGGDPRLHQAIASTNRQALLSVSTTSRTPCTGSGRRSSATVSWARCWSGPGTSGTAGPGSTPVIAILGGGVAGAFLARALASLGRDDVAVFDPAGARAGLDGKALGGFRTQHGNRLNMELALASRDYFAQRAERVDFRANGYLYVATSEAAAVALAERAHCQLEWGLPIEHPPLPARVPYARSDDVVATNFCALDGLYRPPQVLDCVIEEARELGVRFDYGRAATPEDLDGAEAVVICAGARSAEVARSLGVDLDVRAERRGVFQVGPFHGSPARRRCSSRWSRASISGSGTDAC